MNHPDALDCHRAEAVGSAAHCRSRAGVDNGTGVGSSLNREVIGTHSDVREDEIVTVSASSLQNQLNRGRKSHVPVPARPLTVTLTTQSLSD